MAFLSKFRDFVVILAVVVVIGGFVASLIGSASAASGDLAITSIQTVDDYHGVSDVAPGQPIEVVVDVSGLSGEDTYRIALADKDITYFGSYIFDEKFVSDSRDTVRFTIPYSKLQQAREDESSFQNKLNIEAWEGNGPIITASSEQHKIGETDGNIYLKNVPAQAEEGAPVSVQYFGYTDASSPTVDLMEEDRNFLLPSAVDTSIGYDRPEVQNNRISGTITFYPSEYNDGRDGTEIYAWLQGPEGDPLGHSAVESIAITKSGTERGDSATDKDRDGTIDDIDDAPYKPEDKDGFEDSDGIPDPDNDGDGVPDERDDAPSEPEDTDGCQDADGASEPDSVCSSDSQSSQEDNEDETDQNNSSSQNDAPDSESKTITSCRAINESGVYELTSNIESTNGDTCLEVIASDVVINGNGHTIAGPGTDGTVGILVVDAESDSNPAQSNVTVRNLTVSEWSNGMIIGSLGERVVDATVVNITATENLRSGIIFGNSEAGRLEDISASSNRQGVVLSGSIGLRANNLSLTENELHGLTTSGSGDDSVLSNLTVRNNGGTGIFINEDAANNTIVNSTVVNNGGDGITSFYNKETTIRSTIVRSNDGYGISVDRTANVTIEDVQIAENAKAELNLYTELPDNAPTTATLRSVRIGDVALVNAENLSPAGTDHLNIEQIDQDALPGASSDGLAADSGLSVVNLGAQLSVTLNTNIDNSESTESQTTLTIRRHDGDDWVDIGAVESNSGQSTVTGTITDDGVYIPVRQTDESDNNQTSEEDSVGAIDSCTTINESGTYELTDDISSSTGGACIHVRASDVTLDGNGHSVTGDYAADSIGLLVSNGPVDGYSDGEPLTNVTVRDLNIGNWEQGIRAGPVASSPGPQVRFVDISVSNADGIKMYGTDDSVLRDVTVTNGEIGLLLYETNSVTGENLTITGNTGVGLWLADLVERSQFTNLTVTGNDGGGVYFGIDTVDNTITDAFIDNNGAYGVTFSDSGGNLVEDSTIAETESPAIVGESPGGDRLEDVKIQDSGGAALEVRSDGELGFENVSLGPQITVGTPDEGSIQTFEGDRDNPMQLRTTTISEIEEEPPEDPLNERGVTVSNTDSNVEVTFEPSNTVSDTRAQLFRFADGEWTPVGDATESSLTTTLSGSKTVAPFEIPTDDENSTEGTSSIEREIDSCTKIDSPGQYSLTADIQNSQKNTCITITANDVVLDGNGYTIDGVDTDGTIGVELSQPEEEIRNVTITDLTVSDWGTGIGQPEFGQGRLIEAQITETTVTSNNYGVYLINVEQSRVSGSTIEENAEAGIILRDFGNDNRITDNEIQSNTGLGIRLFEGGSNARVSNNLIESNDGDGINAGNAVDDLQIVNNRIESNGADGVEIDDSSGAQIRGNNINENAHDGINVQDVDEVRIEGNQILENGRYGITLAPAEGELENNRLDGNAEWAIYTNSIDSGDIEADELIIGSVTVGFDEEESQNFALGSVSSPPPAENGVQSLDRAVRFDKTDSDGSLFLQIEYTEADIRNAGVEESSIRLWRYDDSWKDTPALAGTDTDRDVTSAIIDAPGIIAPAAESDSVSGNGSSSEDANVLVIESTAENQFDYRIVVEGYAEPTSTDSLSADSEDSVESTSSDSVVITGSTGDNAGDAFSITGSVEDVEINGAEKDYSVTLDGESLPVETTVVTDEADEGSAEANGSTDDSSNVSTESPPINSPDDGVDSTSEPIKTPTEEPTKTPTEEPTETPIGTPAETLTEEPTGTLTEESTGTLTEEPTEAPTTESSEEGSEESLIVRLSVSLLKFFHSVAS